MWRDVMYVVVSTGGLAVCLVAMVYMIYCSIKGIRARWRLLAHMKRAWLLPIFIVAPYSCFLTEAGKEHLKKARGWLVRSVLSAIIGVLGLLAYALMQPRVDPRCAGSTAEVPRAGCPTASR
jgi:tellurite resistance protein TehA-like permease